MRKECEKQLQRLYPHNWTLQPKEDGTIAINGNVLEPRCNIVPDSNATYYLGGKEKVFLAVYDNWYRSVSYIDYDELSIIVNHITD